MQSFNTNLEGLGRLFWIERTIKGILRDADDPPLGVLNVILPQPLHYTFAYCRLKEAISISTLYYYH